MYSISLDVVRGIINIRMRGMLTDVQRDELAGELRQALETTSPSDPSEWLLRVTAKPLAQYTPELATTVCRLIEDNNSRRKSPPPPASRVINCRPAQSGSAAARLVHFVTA
jgi:hypothetical protein